LGILPIIIVEQSQAVIVERLGKFNRVGTTGINPMLPIFDSVRTLEYTEQVTNAQGQVVGRRRKRTNRIDLRESILNFPAQDVITKDNVTIRIDAILYYRIVDPIKVAYAIADFTDAIEKLTQTTLRNVVGELELDHTLTSREFINTRIREVVDGVTDKWGVDVTRVELQDIQPPPRIAQTMELQMTAERERRASVLQAEGEKSSAILKAEGEANAKIKQAEGEAESVIRRAEAAAKARERTAQAEAEAIRTIREAIGDENLVQYLIALRYLETLPAIANSQSSKVFIPYEATGVLGSLGTLRELMGTLPAEGKK
jgi:regulator of protease activity HflC (stomatin/prohibitin superfamily)